jgi:hypothetical protein
MFTALCAIVAGIGGFALAGMIAGWRIALLTANLESSRMGARADYQLLTTYAARIRRAKSMDTPKSNATVKRILRALDGEA